MSTDKISIAILEDFIKKVRLASKGGQKEIKIPVSEAENIVHNLSLLTLRILDRSQKIEPKEEVISIVMDGGGFEEKR